MYYYHYYYIVIFMIMILESKEKVVRHGRPRCIPIESENIKRLGGSIPCLS